MHAPGVDDLDTTPPHFEDFQTFFELFFKRLRKTLQKTCKNVSSKTAPDQPILQTIRNLVIYLLVAGEELTQRAPSRKQ